jgi:RNA polymerase sigma-54 factor
MYETQKETIIPDFTIEERDEELFVVLNTGDIPELHVSRDYSEMLENYKKMPKNEETRQATQFIRQKLDAARWFIDAIKQRNETLTRTMMAIVEAQSDFFYEGDDSALKPMILQDIADKTGYDVSTISRVSNSKYVQTEFGIYPLKHFFSEGMQNIEGDEVSTREIKQALREIIDREDKSHPLNDDELVEAMKAAGYTIARRTVSKYRQQIGKSIARLRKQL